MSAFRTLDELEVSGKKVLVRADLNVPIADGEVSDSSRIESVAPTLAELAKKGAKVVIHSHFGRPKGRHVPAMSLAPLAPHVSAALGGRDVAFAPDCIGEQARQVVEALGDGDVALLENTRVQAGDEKHDAEFAAGLAALGDIFVNDAFSAAHRAHASTTGVAQLLPNAAGRLMQGELEALEGALLTPEHPVVAVVGGAKVSTKIDLLVNLIERVDVLVIGGGMANTFLHAAGGGIFFLGDKTPAPPQKKKRAGGGRVRGGVRCLRQHFDIPEATAPISDSVESLDFVGPNLPPCEGEGTFAPPVATFL